MHPLVRRYAPHSLQWFGRYWRNRLAGHFEREMSTFVKLARPGSIAIDAGANIGFFSYALATRGARVHAFEPIPSCAAMVRTIRGVVVHEVALSDQAATVTMHLPLRNGAPVAGEASLLPSAENHARVPVAAKTLDSFDLRDVSAIKIDVEGHELAVVAGARETLARERPVLLIEIELRHSRKSVLESIAEIERLGYRGTFLSAGGEWLPALRFDPAHHGVPDTPDYVYNFLFRPV